MIRFIDNKDGTVTDTSTNLMWQQSKGERFIFGEAQKYAFSLSLTGYNNWRLPTIEELRSIVELAGYNNWRLPTIEELKSIVDYNRKDPAIDPVFECVSDYYWSGSIVVDSLYNMWGINFNYGHVYWNDTNHCNYIRCVRDFKKE